MSEMSATELNNARRRGLTLVAVAVLLGGAGWGGWHWLAGRHHQSTDNAYVAGNVVQITPQVGGTVVAIRADDTDFVRAGQPLISLDPADAQVALEQAEAQLAQTVREVRTLFANNATLAMQAAYVQLVPAFEALFRQQGQDFPRFHAEVQRLAGLPRPERAAILQALMPPAAPSD